MKDKLLLIAPFCHLYYLPSLIKNNDVKTSTKVSVIFENVILYFLGGAIAGFEHFSFLMLLVIVVMAFLLSPLEWKIIKVIRTKAGKTITNWERMANKKAYYFLQYQLLGYILIGYLIGTLIHII